MIVCILNIQNFCRIQSEHTAWSIDDILDCDFKKEITELQATCFRIQIAVKWTYPAILCGTLLVLVIAKKPVLIGTNNCLPVVTDMMLLFIQTVLLFQGCVIIPALDLLFIGGLVSLLMQLKIASYLISNMDYGQCNRRLRKFVENYSKLLE